MNLTDTIDSLFKSGCVSMTVGRPPQQPNAPAFYVQAEQLVARGNQGDNLRCIHQTAGDSIADCLNRLAEAVEAAAELKVEPSNIITPKRNNL